jgi:flagellar motor switch protein FliG
MEFPKTKTQEVLIAELASLDPQPLFHIMKQILEISPEDFQRVRKDFSEEFYNQNKDIEY